MTAAQGGDRAALDALLRRHHDRLYAVCRRVTGNDTDAADACQEALIAIVRSLDRFDGRSAFSTWAYRVATNACLDELRRRRRRPDPGLPDDLGGRVGRGAVAPWWPRAVATPLRASTPGWRSTPPWPDCRRSTGWRWCSRDLCGLSVRRDRRGARRPRRDGAVAHRPRAGRPGVHPRSRGDG